MRDIQRLSVVLVLVLAALAASGCGGEVELRPPARDGIFYLDLAQAQKAAAEGDQYLLLDMWRPG